MSVLNRTAPAHAATIRETAAPKPLLGGRYVTTGDLGTPAEGTYVSNHSVDSVNTRGTYVSSASRATSARPEGRYTDRG